MSLDLEVCMREGSADQRMRERAQEIRPRNQTAQNTSDCDLGSRNPEPHTGVQWFGGIKLSTAWPASVNEAFKAAGRHGSAPPREDPSRQAHTLVVAKERSKWVGILPLNR